VPVPGVSQAEHVRRDPVGAGHRGRGHRSGALDLEATQVVDMMLHIMTGPLTCTACGWTVTVVYDTHPCDKKPYIFDVEGVCPVTGSYHSPDFSVEINVFIEMTAQNL
jgi:hypothetical protein